MAKEIEVNADAALQAFGGQKVAFKSVNGEKGEKWKTEGNAEAALDALAPVEHHGRTNSILAHGKVDVAGIADDRPTSDSGHPY